MTTQWDHLVGGVKIPRRDDTLPPAAFSRRPPVGTLPRKAFAVLSRPQYQSIASACLPHGDLACAESDVRARLGPTANVELNRMDGYYGPRWLLGEERIDAGCYPDQGAQWYREYGTVGEVLKPYDPTQVTTWKPPASWAKDRHLSTFDLQPMLPDLNQIRAEIAADRIVPVCHHVDLQMTHDAGTTGVERGMTGPSQGGHCRDVVGFDDDDTIPGFSPGVAWLWNWWHGWGLVHPKAATDARFAHFAAANVRDSFSRVPYAVLTASGWQFDFRRLARGLPVEV